MVRRHGQWRYSLGAYVNAMEAIMERDPRSEAAREAATWIIGRDTGAAAGKAIRVLSEHHLQATPSAPLSRQPFDEAQDALERQIDQHTDPQLRALAQLALVEWHLFIEEAARDASKILALEPSEQEEAAFFVGGLRAVEYAQSRDAASEHQAAIKLLIQLREGATEHLPPSEADQAAQLITELLELGLGSVAPEIVGTDLQGDEMRLSDYRGKVVVLDFWGHW